VEAFNKFKCFIQIICDDKSVVKNCMLLINRVELVVRLLLWRITVHMSRKIKNVNFRREMKMTTYLMGYGSNKNIAAFGRHIAQQYQFWCVGEPD
jgi:hypothetical protein